MEGKLRKRSSTSGKGSMNWIDWFRIAKCGGLLWMGWWTFGLHKMRRISGLDEDLLTSQVGLCSMEW